MNFLVVRFLINLAHVQLRENVFVLEAILKSYRAVDDEDFLVDKDEEMDNVKDVYEANPADERKDDPIDFHDEQVDAFKCLECNYRSDSQRGLNVHVGMKHIRKPTFIAWMEIDLLAGQISVMVPLKICKDIVIGLTCK